MAGTTNRPDLTGLKVLLVDDHRDSADSMAWLLQTFGCQADTRFDAASALASVEALNPDVIFLDIRLPDMPGTELCRRLRSLDSLTGTMLIALTGATDDRTLASVREAGFDHTLTKPVELGAILEVLRGAVP
jgi:DNA-binding response OmpR family regulator